MEYTKGDFEREEYVEIDDECVICGESPCLSRPSSNASLGFSSFFKYLILAGMFYGAVEYLGMSVEMILVVVLPIIIVQIGRLSGELDSEEDKNDD